MSEGPKLAQHITALQSLTGLREHPGWAILCMKFQERMTQLEQCRDDLNTGADEAEALRQTKIRVMAQFAPAKILSDLIAHHSAGAQTAKTKMERPS